MQTICERVSVIEKAEIEQKAEELGVHVSNVQRDYVFGWLLAGLSQPNNPLRRQLILKGGNAFRKAYFEHARFSNDLDFSTQVELDEGILHNSIKHACLFAKEQSGVEFLTDESRIGVRDIAEEDTEITQPQQTPEEPKDFAGYVVKITTAEMRTWSAYA
jgi:predicted nucleotidyltransferase component of viral defense system